MPSLPWIIWNPTADERLNNYKKHLPILGRCFFVDIRQGFLQPLMPLV